VTGAQSHGVWWYKMPNNAGMVTVTNGSPNVTISGSTFSTSTSSVRYVPSTTSANWIFWTCAAPCNTNLDGDQTVYTNAQYVDSTHITIGQPYNGPPECDPPNGCAREWRVFNRTQYGVASTNNTAWYWQGFMQGIIGKGLDIAQQALTAESSTEVCDYEGNASTPCVNALADMQQDIIADVSAKGFDPINYGMFYSRGSALCEPNPDGAGYICDQSVASNLTQVPEVAFSFAKEYLRTGDANLKTLYDLNFGRAFGKLGGPNGSSADQQYANDYETNAYTKFYGFCCGVGSGATWLAARLMNTGEWPWVPQTQDVTINYGTNGSTATKVRVALKDANGSVVDTSVCLLSAGSCVVTAQDKATGGHMVRLEYLGSGAADDINCRDMANHGPTLCVSVSPWQPVPVQ
jgi:hypothetical protein